MCVIEYNVWIIKSQTLQRRYWILFWPSLGYSYGSTGLALAKYELFVVPNTVFDVHMLPLLPPKFPFLPLLYVGSPRSVHIYPTPGAKWEGRRANDDERLSIILLPLLVHRRYPLSTIRSQLWMQISSQMSLFPDHFRMLLTCVAYDNVFEQVCVGHFRCWTADFFLGTVCFVC